MERKCVLSDLIGVTCFFGLLLGLVGCSTLPAAFVSPPIHGVLASVALDRSVLPLGGQTEATGILVDRQQWNKPVEDGVDVWAAKLVDGWQRLNPGSVTWATDERQRSDYEAVTAVPQVDSWFGFDQPEAARYVVAQGWNFVGAGDVTKWKALARAWSSPAFWTIRATAFYVLDDVPANQQTYHVSLRNVVTLIDAEGKVLGEATVTSYSESRTYKGWKTARSELTQSLPEAADDFLLKWQRLTQKE